ncbi:MAG: LPS export ABC transporter periplasmic protein LptC [Pseudomonadota bacterium]
MNIRTFLLTAVLVVAALLTWIIVDRPQNNPEDEPTSDQRDAPGYYLKVATITIGGADGTPLYQLHAQRITQNPPDTRIMLSDVRFDYLEERDSPWELRAAQGEISDDQQVVKLFGEVRLINQNEESSTPTTVMTSSLDILPESYVATTDEEVIITHGRYEITAKGLAADLNQGVLQLRSNVHGYFKP